MYACCEVNFSLKQINGEFFIFFLISSETKAATAMGSFVFATFCNFVAPLAWAVGHIYISLKFF